MRIGTRTPATRQKKLGREIELLKAAGQDLHRLRAVTEHEVWPRDLQRVWTAVEHVHGTAARRGSRHARRGRGLPPSALCHRCPVRQDCADYAASAARVGRVGGCVARKPWEGAAGRVGVTSGSALSTSPRFSTR